MFQLTADEGAGAANAMASLLLSSVLSGTRLGSFSIEPNGAVKLGIPVSQSIHATSTRKASIGTGVVDQLGQHSQLEGAVQNAVRSRKLVGNALFFAFAFQHGQLTVQVGNLAGQ